MLPLFSSTSAADLYINQRALFHALSHNAIAGAAIDVWYDYPKTGSKGEPAELPFRELPNVLMTPHSSGVPARPSPLEPRRVIDNINKVSGGPTTTPQRGRDGAMKREPGLSREVGSATRVD